MQLESWILDIFIFLTKQVNIEVIYIFCYWIYGYRLNSLSFWVHGTTDDLRLLSSVVQVRVMHLLLQITLKLFWKYQGSFVLIHKYIVRGNISILEHISSFNFIHHMEPSLRALIFDPTKKRKMVMWPLESMLNCIKSI